MRDAAIYKCNIVMKRMQLRDVRLPARSKILHFVLKPGPDYVYLQRWRLQLCCSWPHMSIA